jgi:tripartite-type tricarboxylate transporter receptor subunit TctC
MLSAERKAAWRRYRLSRIASRLDAPYLKPITRRRIVLRRTVLRVFAAALASAAGAAPALAQDYPSRPITVVVPYNPGGITDQLAREVGAKLSSMIGQPVVIENKPGGAGQIAINALKSAPADGYTVLIADFGPLALNASLFTKLSYDVSKDLRAVTRLINAPSLLVVSPNSSARTVDELFKAAKERGGMSYASPGVGSGGHLFGAMLSRQLGVEMNHAPYRGSGAGLIDVSSGQVGFMFDAIVTSGEMVRGDKVRALAIGADRRSPLFPQVPTLKELGYESLSAVSWFGAMVKAGTPDPIVDKLNAGLRAAVSDPSVSKKFTDQGVEIVTSSPQEFSAFIKSETERWGKVIHDAGITVE